MINQICSVVSEFEKRLSNWESNLSELRTDLKAQEKMVDEPFERQADLDKARNRYNEIIAELSKTDEQYGGEETQYQDKYEDDRYEDSRDAELLGRIRAYGRNDLLRQSRENAKKMEVYVGRGKASSSEYVKPRVGSEGWLRELEQNRRSGYDKDAFRALSQTELERTDTAGRTLSNQVYDRLKRTVLKNPDGTVLSLFHWTPNLFTRFEKGDIGFHFGTLKAARAIQIKKANAGTGYFKEVYCVSENPFIVRDSMSWSPEIMAMRGYITVEESEEIQKSDPKYYAENLVFSGNKYNLKSNKKLREILKRHGYDSLIYINNHEDGISLMVFDDNQIITVSENGIPVDDVQYQDRTTTLSDNDVLSMAAETIDKEGFTQEEKNALDIVKKKLSELDGLIDQRIEQGRIYKEQQFGKPADRVAAEQTRNRMKNLEDMIRRKEDEILSIKEKNVIKGILKKSRKIAYRAPLQMIASR